MGAVLAAIVVGFFGIPTACFALMALFEGFPKIRLGQVAWIVAIAAVVFGVFTVGPNGEVPLMAIVGLGLLFIHFSVWRREMGLLMARRDDEFPGRYDKLGWFLLLTLMAPAGIWLFRSYRKSRWPEAPGESRASSPWDLPEEDGAEALAGAAASRVD